MILSTEVHTKCLPPAPIWSNIFWNFDKYIPQFRQIHFATWTNTFCNFDKYILKSGKQQWSWSTEVLAGAPQVFTPPCTTSLPPPSATNTTDHFRKSARAKDWAKSNGKRDWDEKYTKYGQKGKYKKYSKHEGVKQSSNSKSWLLWSDNYYISLLIVRLKDNICWLAQLAILEHVCFVSWKLTYLAPGLSDGGTNFV